MPKKRGIEDIDRQSLSPMAPGTSDFTPRKKVTAATTGSVTKSPGKSKGQQKERKKIRLEKYHNDMAILNACIADWAKKEELKLCHTIESTSSSYKSTSTSDAYTDQLHQYITKAREIKQKYFPPTGNLLTFGANECGQLAHREEVEGRMRPSAVITVRNIGITQVACGALHNIILTEQGKVLTWGCNDEGSLGRYKVATAYAPVDVYGFIPARDELANNLQPAKYTWSDLKHAMGHGYNFSDPSVEFDPKYEDKIVRIASGDTQCLALSETGRVYSFGSVKDTEGQSWGDATPKDDPRKYPDYAYVSDESEKEWDWPPDPNTFKLSCGKRHWPTHVNKLPGKAVQVSCGFAYNAALVDKQGAKNAVVVTWGLGQSGELSRPVRKNMKAPKSTFEGLDYDADETKIMFARNPYIKYNIETVHQDYMTPKEVVWAEENNNRIIENVVCGGYHLLVIAKSTEDGKSQLYSCGLNNYGQCGHPVIEGDANNRDRLMKVEPMKHVDVSQVAGGEHFTIVLDSTRTKLYGFGRTCSGQLGYTEDQPEAGSFSEKPVQIYLEYDTNGKPIENPVIARIASGGSHSFALTENGDCYSWGYGFMGQLGIGKKLDDDCLFRPKKISPTFGVNMSRLMEGQSPYKATVQLVDGGAQHSAMIATLEEVTTLPPEDSILEEKVRELKQKQAEKKLKEW